MTTLLLSYESVNIADLTRLLRHLEDLQGSTQQFSDCKRGYTKLPTLGFASAADQKRVALSQFVADLSVVKASMDWLVHNSRVTSTDTTSSGESSTPTGESQQTEDTGTPMGQMVQARVCKHCSYLNPIALDRCTACGWLLP